MKTGRVDRRRDCDQNVTVDGQGRPGLQQPDFETIPNILKVLYEEDKQRQSECRDRIC